MMNWADQKALKRQAKAALSARLKEEGFSVAPPISASNSKAPYATIEEERVARQETAGEYLQVLQRMLPTILKHFSDVPDFRNPKKTKHKMAVVLMLGLLTFVLHKASRREANRELTTATFMETLRLLFPDIESLPHHDTVNRVLAGTQVAELEKLQVELLSKFVRSKKFANYLIRRCYPLAVDGTQKLAYDFPWAEECQHRKVQDKTKYSCYVLEASFVFHNGMVLPVATEILDSSEGDTEQTKQDCELKGFKRLAAKIKGYFPKLKIMVLLDGLYANGPVMKLCRQYNWQFMIVLQDDSLRSVWEEADGLRSLETNNYDTQKWGNRNQHFWWVNDIEYWYDHDKKMQKVHLVVCKENWYEVDDLGQVIEKKAKHAWLSSESLDRYNVHERCNLGARYRWGIENGFLVEKKHGYQYEHAFSFNWNASRGYHLLMRLAHFINVIVEHSELLNRKIKRLGVQAFIKFLDETLRGPWLDLQSIKARLCRCYQLRLVQ